MSTVSDALPDKTGYGNGGRRAGRSARGAAVVRQVRGRLTSWLTRPLASLHLVVGLLVLLTGLGLVMVLSASSVEAYALDGSAYSLFTRQVIFAVAGLVLFYVGLRLPVRIMRRYALPALVTCVVLLALVLVPGVGHLVNGARAWFVLGPVSLQPSEPTKIIFAVWGAHLLAIKRGQLHSLRHMLIPLIPAALLIVALIVVEPDLGNTITLGLVIMGLLWFAGAPVKLFLALVLAAGGGALVLALSVSYRSARIASFLNPSADPQGAGYQAMQATYALADGGLWGVGLGQSRAKWSYLPEAQNDFIFAIIGEELGFIGAALVLVLFGVLACVGLRIAARSADPFLRLVTATVTVWLVGQAIINIGYVVGGDDVRLWAAGQRGPPRAAGDRRDAHRWAGEVREAAPAAPSRAVCRAADAAGGPRATSAPHAGATSRAGSPARAGAAPTQRRACSPPSRPVAGDGRPALTRSLCCLWWLASTTPGPRGTWVSLR